MNVKCSWLILFYTVTPSPQTATSEAFWVIEAHGAVLNKLLSSIIY